MSARMKNDSRNHVVAGRYRLLHIAGEGGMAVVWRAQLVDRHGERLVAIKRMLVDIARDPALVAMFIEEARVGSQLRHPNIVQVLDFGTDETGTYYLVLEWVEGLTCSITQGRSMKPVSTCPGRRWPLLVIRPCSGSQPPTKGWMALARAGPSSIAICRRAISSWGSMGW